MTSIIKVPSVIVSRRIPKHLVCERCKREIKYNSFIDQHPLCRDCSDGWSKFFHKYYSKKLKPIDRRKEKAKWHKVWEQMFKEYLETVEERVNFD